MMLEQKIKAFFQRVAQRANEKKLPIELKGFIQQSDLISIYSYIMENQDNLSKKLVLGNSCRLDKKNTKLSRTLNLVFDLQYESLSLILETKNKTKEGLKFQDKNKEVFFQGNRKVKPAWIIDEAIPKKIANTVFYIESETDFLKIKKQTDIPRGLIKKYPDSEDFINIGVFGEIVAEKNRSKISFYYSWPNAGNLSSFLKSKNAYSLSSVQLDEFALQLMESVKYLHDAGMIYQNINTENILVYLNKMGGYYFKLSNFKEAYEINFPALNNKAVAGLWYESPEIAVIEKKLNNDERFSGYGVALSKSMLAQAEYANPHAANDMWALGVILHRLYYKIHPTEQNNSNFNSLIAQLLHPVREERLTIDQALKHLREELALTKTKNELKIVEFFQRIKERAKENSLPAVLSGLIRQEDLRYIYKYVIDNEQAIRRGLEKKQPFRLDKRSTGLARTLNLIFDPKIDDIYLMLETKKKNQSGAIKTSTEVFLGGYKTTKLAWAIDGPIPIKFANSVFYFQEGPSLLKAKTEVSLPLKVIKKYSDKNVFLNLTTLGSIIDKKGIRNKEDYSLKLSFYSLWASSGNLEDFLRKNKSKLLPEDLDRITRELILAVKSLHDTGIVHQDIKLANILIFQDSSGKYSIELADFGEAYEQGASLYNSFALATLSYESPEIASFMTNQPTDSSSYKYYADQRFESYGRDLSAEIVLKKEYNRPHPANDMWSLGIVLYKLYHNHYPTKANPGQFSALIAGLLNPDREKRLTAEQAYVILSSNVEQEKCTKELSESMLSLSLEHKTYQPQFKQKNSAKEKVSRGAFHSKLRKACKKL
jgi:serine/threonine protein kinase